MSIDKFRNRVNAVGGIYYRLDNGYIVGRNSAATDDALDWHFKQARTILANACLNDSDPLPEYLDSKRGARLAAKWAALEHRYYGIR